MISVIFHQGVLCVAKKINLYFHGGYLKITLNYLTSHLTRPVISKTLGHEGNHLLVHTQFIDYKILKHSIFTMVSITTSESLNNTVSSLKISHAVTQKVTSVILRVSH